MVFRAVVLVRVKWIAILFHCSFILSDSHRFFLSVGIFNCNLQKTSGNFHPERDYVGRVTGTHRAKKRLETESENMSGRHGAPEIERR